MLSRQWRAAIKPSRLRTSPAAIPLRTHPNRNLHIKFRPQGNSCLRPQQPQSRALGLHSSSKPSLLRWKHHGPSQKNPLLATPPFSPLQSRFPKKTFIALLLIGGYLYWAVEDVPAGDFFLARLYDTYENSSAVQLFHDYRNREEVDHALEHIRNHGDAADALDSFLVNAHSTSFAFGERASWMMDGEEARELGMPITHGFRMGSNTPCEDHLSLGTAPGPGAQPWNYWGVYDGHAGVQTSEWLTWSLIPQVSRALSSLPLSSAPFLITRTIMETFTRLDDTMLDRAKTKALWQPAASAAAFIALTPVVSGSCALLSMYDPSTSKLRVACVGDSRAVLGRWDPLEEKYTCIPLSVDQTGFNESEVSRIKEAHPEEDSILDSKSGRLLGIAVTRAFGDHRWKWTTDVVKQVQYKFGGPAPRPNSKTPPYMTAEPVVEEVDVVSVGSEERAKTGARSDFMIMASDGMWDRISSEHAVECVQRWLEAKERGNGRVANDPELQLQNRNPLPPSVSKKLEPGVTCNPEEGQDVDWKAEPEFFLIEGENAATCLGRNILGGNRKNLFFGLMAAPPSVSRNLYDDTTIMVVFFDKVEEKKVEKKRWFKTVNIKKLWSWSGEW